jgi:group II intron reverse transcriptase/maturase
MVLEAVYEEDFLDCSYGFRPGRSAHDALGVLRQELSELGGGWVLEVDVQSFFDELSHEHLRAFLDRRVRDGVIRKAIGKWLQAGVMEEGRVRHSEAGTPQGGVISPLLANVYLHEVVDRWFAEEVKPRLRGRARLVRYADDLVIVFADEHDARRVEKVLAKRFARFGLRLHPQKTRLVRFRRPPWGSDGAGPEGPGTFVFLGFTHLWAKGRKRGSWVVRRKTAASRLTRSLKRVREWCRRARHWPLAEQQRQLSRRLLGHYAYYGIRGNFRALANVYYQVIREWRKRLDRRSGKRTMSWERFNRLAKVYPLPRPRIVHSV